MKTIAFLFGGRSAEHSVSIASAAALFPRLQERGMHLFPIFIEKDGALYTFCAEAFSPKQGILPAHRTPLCAIYQNARLGFRGVTDEPTVFPDAALSLLHGTYGEDGAWQGLFTLASLPFFGCGIRPSALAMHKPTAKILAAFKSIPTLPYITLTRADKNPAARIAEALTYPVFIKPASGGSSLGASAASNETALTAALDTAFSYDDELIVEPYLPSDELSVAVWEDEGGVHASPVGLTRVASGFYDYRAKYESAQTRFLCPAPLSEAKTEETRKNALTLFRLFGCRHMARIDFLLAENGEVYFSEINTIPGFTDHSLFPRLLRAADADPFALFSGVSV